MKKLDFILFFTIGFSAHSFLTKLFSNDPYFVFPMWVLIISTLIVLIRGCLK